MNLFFIDKCPIISAIQLCDKHIVKMVLETAQMCSTAIHEWCTGDEPILDKIYKSAYKNHPMTVWVRENDANMSWAVLHGLAIGREYTYRYGRTHLTFTKLADIFRTHPKNLPDGPRQEFAVAIAADQTCRQIPSFNSLKPVDKYKQYIINDKPFAVWTSRQPPSWFKNQAYHK